MLQIFVLLILIIKKYWLFHYNTTHQGVGYINKQPLTKANVLGVGKMGENKDPSDLDKSQIVISWWLLQAIAYEKGWKQVVHVN